MSHPVIRKSQLDICLPLSCERRLIAHPTSDPWIGAGIGTRDFLPGVFSLVFLGRGRLRRSTPVKAGKLRAEALGYVHQRRQGGANPSVWFPSRSRKCRMIMVSSARTLPFPNFLPSVTSWSSDPVPAGAGSPNG